jgi:hypothetical protein
MGKSHQYVTYINALLSGKRATGLSENLGVFFTCGEGYGLLRVIGCSWQMGISAILIHRNSL